MLSRWLRVGFHPFLIAGISIYTCAAALRLVKRSRPVVFLRALRCTQLARRVILNSKTIVTQMKLLCMLSLEISPIVRRMRGGGGEVGGVPLPTNLLLTDWPLHYTRSRSKAS